MEEEAKKIVKYWTGSGFKYDDLYDKFPQHKKALYEWGFMSSNSKEESIKQVTFLLNKHSSKLARVLE